MGKVVNGLIRLVERVTSTNISIQRIRNTGSGASKYSEHYLSSIASLLERVATFKPRNLFEIGANYGQDAEFLRNRLSLKNSDVYIFEPHPEIVAQARKSLAFNCYPFAVSDKNGKMIFHAISLKSTNSGISSLRKHSFNEDRDYFEVEVDVIRMDTFIADNNIAEIDFLKVDVEGAGYEVLTGFGKTLGRVKAVQIESEYLPVWVGQKTWDDISGLLSKNGFQLVHFELQEDGIQSDSFWIRKDLIRHRIYNISTKQWHEQRASEPPT